MSAPPLRFSIVIPCFNQGAFLQECLQSVAAQTLAPHEVIVVDDGSTDPWTIQELDRLCRGNVQLVRQENRGLSGARNAGVRRATGDWILPLDCDDQIAPDALERYAEAMAAHPEVDVWYPDVQHIGLMEGLWTSPAYNPWRQLSYNQFLCSSAIRRTVFDSGVLYNERMRRGYEDWEFYIHACVERGFRARALGHPVFRYRKWGYSMLSDSHARAAEILEQMHSERPVFRDEAALLRLKRQHAPFFAVAARSKALATALEAQTFQDFRLVDDADAVHQRGDLSPFHGQLGHGLLVSLCDDALGRALAQDRFLLEKLATIQQERSPSAIWLVTEPAASAYPGAVATWRLDDASRAVGVVISLHHLLDRPDFTRTDEGWAYDLASHLDAHHPRSALRVVVGPLGDPAEGIPVPPTALQDTPGTVPASREPERRRYERLFLMGLGVSKFARGALGPDRHDRILDSRAVKAVKAGLLGGNLRSQLRRLSWSRRPAKPAIAASAEPQPQVVHDRVGPFDPALHAQPRHREEAWFISREPPRFPTPSAAEEAVLIAAPWIVHGGVDRGLVDLAQGLRAVAPEVRRHLVTTEPARMTWAPELLPALDGVFRLGDIGSKDPVEALCALAERLGVRSLLIANSALACEALPKLRRRIPNLRVVVQVHSFDTDRKTGQPTGRAADAASRYNNLIDAYAAISVRAGRTLSERLYVSPSKIHTVYLGIDHARFSRAAAERFRRSPLRVLWLGRLSEEKDPLLALEVARRFKERHGAGRLQLRIAGNGPLDAELKARCREHGLEDMVSLVGGVDDPVPLYADADCLMLTSRYEGIPIVIYEAMAAGLPAVTPTANTAIDEVLSPREAILVDPRETEGFVSALERLCSDSALGTSLAAEVSAQSARFSRERYARETLEVLLPARAALRKAS